MAQLPDWLLTPLIVGLVLDSLLGDPSWLPHPIRGIGFLISWGEKKLNRGTNQLVKGFVLVLVLTLLIGGVLYALLGLTVRYPYLHFILETILVFYGIANRSLITETFKVERILTNKGIGEARKQLRYIVGRDTDELSENQIRKANLETLSENLSDGVIAPLFFYFIGGVPLLFVYKTVNTFDSMIGYKNERYYLFGRFAAKTDDVLNYLPARITALLMVIASASWRGLMFIFSYGHKHSSPNAGYPEAALAGILNCTFGGVSYYQGKRVEKPVIGNNDRMLTPRDLFIAFYTNIATLILLLLVYFLL